MQNVPHTLFSYAGHMISYKRCTMICEVYTLLLFLKLSQIPTVPALISAGSYTDDLPDTSAKRDNQYNRRWKMLCTLEKSSRSNRNSSEVVSKQSMVAGSTVLAQGTKHETCWNRNAPPALCKQARPKFILGLSLLKEIRWPKSIQP